MKTENSMKKILIFTLSACILFLFIGVLPIHGEEKIYDTILRLHVIANSDSEEDQALKETIRDAILAQGNDWLNACQSREEAAALISEKQEVLLETARQTIAEAGFSYDVRIELSEEEYPTKQYGSICFPSGTYLSLRVIIGEGEGQNWWCVLFPPLCMSSAMDRSEEEPFIAVGLTEDQYRVITETDRPTYKIRFKLLETIQRFQK